MSPIDFSFSVRATDAAPCFGDRTLALSIFAAVPTLPQVFVVLLAAGLLAAGYLRLRRRARAR